MEFFAHSPSKIKPNLWHSLDKHLDDVAELCHKFGSKFGQGEFCFNLGLFHDAGKYNPDFQLYLKNSHNNLPTTKVKHSMRGSKHVFEKHPIEAFLISGHHSIIKNPENFKKSLKDHEDVEELVFLEEKSKTNSFEPQALMFRMCFSALIDADRIDTAIFYNPKLSYLKQERNIKNSHKQTFDGFLAKFVSEKNELNDLRNKVRENCIQKSSSAKGAYCLTAPTGIGKTISVVAFAVNHAISNKMDRIILVNPFTSIIQQNTVVYQSSLGKTEVLEHHSNIIYENEDDEYYVQMKKNFINNWNYPVINTTFNQFFDSLFSNKPSKLRKLHNINNSVIILDEVQSIPTNKIYDCLTKLKDLIENYNCTIVFCTATPFDYKNWGFDCIELCDYVEQIFDKLNRVEYKISDLKIEDELNAYDTVLCVVNTKGRAAELFSKAEGDNVFHLSSNMTPKHKTETLDEIKRCLSQKLSCKVISTQVIECGVDLDFPVVLTEKCPLFSLIQRAGRCNREGKLDKGKVMIFDCQDSHLPADKYYRELSNKTFKLLEEDDNLNLIHNPDFCKNFFKDIHDLYAKSFKIGGQDVQKFEDRLMFEDSAKFCLIDDDTFPVIANYHLELKEELQQIIENDEFINDELKQKIQNHTVNIPIYKKKKNSENILNVSCFSFWTGEYDEFVGIILD